MSLHLADSWQHILLWCNIPQLTRLWACGDSILQTYLANTVGLKGNGIYQPCLQYLKGLRELDLSSDMWIPPSLTSRLPPHLTVLSLDNTLNKLDLNVLPVSLTDLTIRMESLISSGVALAMDLTVLPPNLINLDVYGAVRIDMPLTDQPRFCSMRSLSLRCIHVIDSNNIFFHCPNLTTLISDVLVEVDHDLNYAPHLDHVVMRLRNENRIPLSLLKGNQIQGTNSDVGGGVTYHGKCSTSLTISSLDELSEVSWLTCLTIVFHIKSETILQLPVTITDLNISVTDENNSNIGNMFQRFTQLNSLAIYRPISYHNVTDITTLSGLPQTLRKLKAINYCHVEVPRNVVDLDLTSGARGLDNGTWNFIETSTTVAFDIPRLLSHHGSLRGFIPLFHSRLCTENTHSYNKRKKPISNKNTIGLTLILDVDQDQQFYSLLGISCNILSYLTDFSHLRSLSIEYYPLLNEILKLSSHRMISLTDLAVYGSYTSTMELTNLFLNSCKISTLTKLRWTLIQKPHEHHVANQRIAELSALTMSSNSPSIIPGDIYEIMRQVMGKSLNCYDTILDVIVLPLSLKSLTCNVSVNLPGLSFPASLEELVLDYDTHFTPQQVLELARSSLLNINLTTSMNRDNLWNVLNAFPRSVNIVNLTVIVADRDHQPFSDTQLQEYIEGRSRFLQWMEIKVQLRSPESRNE